MPISAVVGIYAVIKLKITLDDQAHCQRKLDEAFNSVNNIYQSIIEFINTKRQAKTSHIQQAIHSASYGMTYGNDNFSGHFRGIASNYDMSHEPHFSEGIKSIRENFKGFPEISQAAFFKVACDEYANCSFLYNNLSTKYKITAPLNKEVC